MTRVKRRKRRTGFQRSGADRETRYTLEPAAARHLHEVQTDPSVTIRPRIPTPAQRVSRICAVTDDVAAEALIRQLTCVRFASRFTHETGGLSMWGVGSAFLPG